MNDPRDFIALTGYGTIGCILVGLGLLGCLLHRRSNRLASSAGIALIGAWLVLDGAQMFHRLRPAWTASVALAICAAAIFSLFFRRGNDSSDQPCDSADSSLVENDTLDPEQLAKKSN